MQNANDKKYMEHLHSLARLYLGKNVILYTTDGGNEYYMNKGSINSSDVFTVGDFGPTDDPSVSFLAQKIHNAAGKSPNMCSEFYTGFEFF